MNNEIDYQSPTHHLDEVLFKVKLQDVYSNFRFVNTLFNLPVGTPDYRAVVNQSSGAILSIVSKNYQLISNEEAIKTGKEIFTKLFPAVKANELIPYKVVAPKSLASAHIDLIHKDVNFNVWEQETWLPFLRTTNSYNRSVALSYEIGFVRKLCSNGVLFNKDTMKLKFLHNKGNKVDAESAANKIRATSDLFSSQCIILKNHAIPRELMFALVCKVLNINLEIPENNQLVKKMKSLEYLYELTHNLTTEYSNQFGINAYTAFNVLTDLVSHQDQYKILPGYYFNVRSYFTRPADWMEEFSDSIKKGNLVYTNYLKDTIDRLERIKNQTGFVWELN